MFASSNSTVPIEPQYTDSLLTTRAYDPESQIFLCDDKHLFFGFLSLPLSGLDSGLDDRLNGLLNQDWPDDTLLQCGLISSPDIMNTIHQLFLAKDRAEPRFKAMLKQNIQQLQADVHKPVTNEQMLRHGILWFTVKVPIHELSPNDDDLLKIRRLKSSFQGGIETAGFLSTPMSQHDWLRLNMILVNHHEHGHWAVEGAQVDSERPLNCQVFDPDTPLRTSPDQIQLGSNHKSRTVKVLVAKKLPAYVPLGQAFNYLGDSQNGHRGIKCYAHIHVLLHFPSINKLQSSLSNKQRISIQQASSPITRFEPRLMERKKDFDVLFEALNKGDAPLKLTFSLVLYSNSPKEASRFSSNACSYFRELGFMLYEDVYFMLPMFLNTLPGNAQKSTQTIAMHEKTLATRHAVPLLPLFDDWPGHQEALLNMVSRRGQLMNLSLFESNSNYNAIIAATSGAGKTVLVNEIISNILIRGGQCWALDIGEGYKKLCQHFDGLFLDFDQNSQIGLNPFALVHDYEEEGDILLALIIAMVSPREPLTPYQEAGLREQIRELWEQESTGSTIDLLQARLRQHPDERITDLAVQLSAFTSKGEYGRFFSGENTLDINQSFTVLELRHLDSRKHLQRVVILELIYLIQQIMYFGDVSRRKLVVIDEAWNLMRDTQGAALFIEHGFRRFRRFNGANLMAAQRIEDFYETPAGRAALDNSATQFLLKQQLATINELEKQLRLPLSPEGYKLLKTVHTVEGKYSEALVLTEQGSGIGRLILNPFKKLLYSSHPEDESSIRAYRSQGLSLSDAIMQVLQDRNAV
ncbi:type IV secretion system protein TraC [Endozoicomonas arenosclerae]|uniref:type IV secretion system protein TraC n=1 Tax=Endozoicomonas arenosclerae TaxID=1633495 RepID=UPI000781A989|nr:type IV secretion system protein TraC [Endozoicomonas arenosclerae]